MNPQLSPIQPAELRIGNWVTKLETAELAYRLKTGAEIDEVYWPVPVTEEILEACGGVLLPGVPFFEIDLGQNIGQIHINPNNGTVWLGHRRVPASLNPVSILYVHQLQNLFFALTGTELPLELDNIPLQEG
ncbi:MAG TPA: hypothetical protein VK666_07885 [Chryseolinea sp.]|nr:hypothetical protein [Chryseolinea sp.]